MKKLTGEFRETVILDGKDPATKLFCTEFDDNNQVDDDKIFTSMVRRVHSMAKKPTLVVSVDASHMGYVNDNFRYYKPETAAISARSWTNPYPKPVLVEHRLTDGFGEKSDDPIGRVVKAAYVPFQLTGRKANDIITRKGVQRVYATIVGIDAIEKVMDGRYLTVSTRGISNSIRCSICKQELMEDHCDHEMGQKYDGGRLAYMIYDVLTYREWSYVKLPADTKAKNRRYELILPVGEGESGGDSKMMPVEVQITKNIGNIDCDCEDAAPNVSIYAPTDNNEFVDLLPTNVEFGGVIQRVLDGIDVYECRHGVCSYKPEDTTAGDLDRDKIPNEFSDQESNTTKEEDEAMENIKSFDDLLKLDFVKKGMEKHFTDELINAKADVKAKDGEITQLKSDIEAKDKVITARDETITKLNDQIKDFEDKRKEIVVDNIVELQKTMKHPSMEAIMKKEKDTQDKELETYKKELLARDSKSLEYLYTDLQNEAKLQGDGNGGDGNGDGAGGAASDAIDSKINNGQTPVNGQTASTEGGDKGGGGNNTSPVDKLFTSK